MERFIFNDALAGSVVACGFPQLEAEVKRGLDHAAPCESLFFPGCSLLNYGLTLVQAVYQTLQDSGCVDSISLLCCGKILSFEPDGAAVRASFEDQLRDRVAHAGVQRIVAACPNCVKTLRDAFASDERTAGVDVVALPAELARVGYRIDAEVARRMISQVSGCSAEEVLACVHDSCPDRDTGEFADGLRALMPEELLVETTHAKKRSYCCGSLLRAAGKPSAADALATRHGEEAIAVAAKAIVTACASCTFQLTASQTAVPTLHYLELLYDWKIDWTPASRFMKLRFLLDDALDAVGESDGSRAFASLEVES